MLVVTAVTTRIMIFHALLVVALARLLACFSASHGTHTLRQQKRQAESRAVLLPAPSPPAYIKLGARALLRAAAAARRCSLLPGPCSLLLLPALCSLLLPLPSALIQWPK